MNHPHIRSACCLFAILATPFLAGAGSDGCGGGDVPIGDDTGGAAGAGAYGGHQDGVACGPDQCNPGEECCNESCGICTPKGGACIMIACEPGDTPCGENVCGAGEYCCNPSCGLCAPEGGACPTIACEPQGEPCGESFCATGEYCCNPSCGLCAAEGDGCIEIACEPTGVACGDTFCGDGEECCNESCSICVPEGGSCTQQICDDERTPVSGACVKNAGDACGSDTDCTAGGCGGEVCFNPALSEGTSTCECTQPAYACGCVDGVCTWYE